MAAATQTQPPVQGAPPPPSDGGFVDPLQADKAALDTEEKQTQAQIDRLYGSAQQQQKAAGDTAKRLESLQADQASSLANAQPPQELQKQANPLSRLAPLLLISAFGGKVAKLNASAMLGATTGTIQGFLAGNQEKYQEQHQAYEDAYKRYMDHMAQIDKVYQTYEEAYKGRLDYQQKAWEATLKTLDEQEANKKADLREKAELDRGTAMLRTQHEAAESTDYYRKSMLKLDTQKVQSQAEAQKQQDIGAGVISMISMGVPVNQALPGFGQKAAQMRLAAQQQATEQIADTEGVDLAAAGQILARRQEVYKGVQSSVNQQMQMLGATRSALAQLEYNVKMAKATLATLPGSDLSPVTNAIARGAQKWTGDPRYKQLFYYMYGVATEAARITSGGQASKAQLAEGAREEAKSWVDVNMTPKSFIQGVAPAMIGEGQNRVQNFQDAIKSQLQMAGSDFGATAGEKPPPEAGGAAAGGAPPSVTTDAQYDALASGTVFTAPDGTQRKKP